MALVSSKSSEQKLVSVVTVGGGGVVLPDAAGRWDVSGKSKWSHKCAPSHSQQLLACIWGPSAQNKTLTFTWHHQSSLWAFVQNPNLSDPTKEKLCLRTKNDLSGRLYLIPRVVLCSYLCGCLLMLSHISCHSTKIAAGGRALSQCK